MIHGQNDGHHDEWREEPNEWPEQEPFQSYHLFDILNSRKSTFFGTSGRKKERERENLASKDGWIDGGQCPSNHRFCRLVRQESWLAS